MTRSPRQTFVTSPLREPMEKISMSEPFLVACDYALLILGEEHPDPANALSQPQMVGARRVLEILKTIHEPITPAKAQKPAGLNYNQK